MASILAFRIAVVKPNRRVVLFPRIRATDRAWRTAIFGIGGSSKRIGGAKIGAVRGQPLAVIGELPEEVEPHLPVWTIETESGLYAFAGPCAVYNDAGFGPASIGIDRATLESIVAFDPEPERLAAGLKKTLETRSQKP